MLCLLIFRRGSTQKSTELGIVVHAVERVEIAKEIFVCRPVRRDRYQQVLRANSISVGRREPGLSDAADPRKDHKPTCLQGKMIPPKHALCNAEPDIREVLE